jgi:hypothetical protein
MTWGDTYTEAYWRMRAACEEKWAAFQRRPPGQWWIQLSDGFPRVGPFQTWQEAIAVARHTVEYQAPTGTRWRLVRSPKHQSHPSGDVES